MDRHWRFLDDVRSLHPLYRRILSLSLSPPHYLLFCRKIDELDMEIKALSVRTVRRWDWIFLSLFALLPRWIFSDLILFKDYYGVYCPDLEIRPIRRPDRRKEYS